MDDFWPYYTTPASNDMHPLPGGVWMQELYLPLCLPPSPLYFNTHLGGIVPGDLGIKGAAGTCPQISGGVPWRRARVRAPVYWAPHA